ncbi:MAG TPA: glucose 1-dehydrogenase [Solirubrobacterales bacterium]|nr:glucose 1-dehydrogenase [Solirubrobacterales bacterium]
MAESSDPTRRFRLDGRTAVVTGASSGLGERFARVLAAAGAAVVAGARRADRLERLVEALRSRGFEARAQRCDVTDDAEVERLIASAVAATGRLDVLVNAAGIAPAEDAAIESPELFRRVMAVNATGLYVCTRAAAAAMLEGGGGAIVNVASISGLVAGDGYDTPSYAASKGAVVNLTRELAVRWAPDRIRVNALAPGWFPSEMTAGTLASEAGRRFVAERTPLGRPGEPSELDGALLFLASDASSYVTGQVLPVDGGWTAR